MSSIDPISLEEKKNWVETVGKTTYIANYARSNPEFFKTSCLLTAAVLRYRLTNKIWWDMKEEGFKLTREVISTIPLFQVGFGEDGDYDDHMVTVFKGKVYHSFYKKFEWQVVDIDVDEEEIDLYHYLFGESKSYVVFVP